MLTFPGESAEYRSARDKLLESERELRRQIEAVAEERRKLPLGAEIAQDYLFHDLNGSEVRFSQLFADGKDSLIVYNYMYGPQMAQPCVMCTSILDGLDGQTPHVRQRVSFAVVAKSPAERIRAFAQPRGWRFLPLYSSHGTTYNHDYHGEDEKGAQMPMLNVFVRRDGRVHHAYGTELLFAAWDAGQDARHVDLIWPLWNLFDFTPEGRGSDWYPKLSY